MDICDYFPFDTFRPHQKRILINVDKALNKGTDVIIIDGATGFGKSPVNIALGLKYAPSFYTTPQVKLVEQLNRDFGQKELAIDGGISSEIMALLGRYNYRCRETGYMSDECPIKFDKDVYCSKQEGCTYWKQKEATMRAKIAILTFAMLIVNNYLPGEYGFSKRKLLIIDECHSLENDVASMFCGFTIKEWDLNYKFKRKKYILLKKIPHKLKERNNRKECIIANDFINYIKELRDILKDTWYNEESEKRCDKIEKKIKNINYMFKEFENDRIWIINLNLKEKSIEFKPIRIDKFLKSMIWSQGKQIVLSSATIPYRNNPKKWLERIGLKDKTYSFHSAPMIFPLKNRPIITKYIGREMTYGKEKENWNYNIKLVKEIMDLYKNERGVIHAVSYGRAFKLSKELYDYNIFLHDKEFNNEEGSSKIITKWQESNKKMLISPSVMDGVDLKDDMCRYQILFKVPYPDMNDGRVKYLVDKKYGINDWYWYMNETAKNVVQAYGRAVRSETDYADFYIIDGSFNNLRKRVKFPDYFLEAIDPEEAINPKGKKFKSNLKELRTFF